MGRHVLGEQDTRRKGVPRRGHWTGLCGMVRSLLGWERHSRQRYQQKPKPRGGTSVRVVNEGISGCKLDGCLCSKRFSSRLPPLERDEAQAPVSKVGGLDLVGAAWPLWAHAQQAPPGQGV